MATTKTTEHSYTGNGSTTNYTVSFEYLKEADVKVTLDHVATTAYTFANATTVQFNTAPANGVAIRIYRDTDVDAARFTFASGSALKAAELNENLDQLLYADQEAIDADGLADEAVTTAKLRDNAVTAAKIANSTITADQLASNAVTTAKINDQAVTTAKLADSSVTSAKIADGGIATADLANDAVTSDKIENAAVVEAKIANGAVTTNKIADDNVTTSKILNANVTTAKIADANVTTAKVADSAVTTAKIAGDAVTSAKIADSAVTSAKIADGTISTADIGDGQVASAKLATGSVVEAKIANDAVTQSKIAAGAVTQLELALGSVTTAKIADDAVTSAKIADDAVVTAAIADDAVTSAQIAANAVGASELANNAVDGPAIANNAVGTAKIVDGNITTAKLATGSVTTGKIANSGVTTGKIASNAVTVDKINDGEITVAKMDGAAVVTNSEQAASTPNDTSFFTTSASDGRYFRQDSTETITSGVTWSDSDAFIATTAAIDDRIIDLIDDVGGFTPIANETSFPTTNPQGNTGTTQLVSIKALSADLTPSSGTITIANGAGTGNTVTINNAGTATLPAGFGVIVETTGTLHTYNFHRLQPKATEVTAVATNITNVVAVGTNISSVNDFADRYRVSAADPTTRADGSALEEGDLYYNTAQDVIKAFNGSSYDKITPDSSQLNDIAIVANDISTSSDLGSVADALIAGGSGGAVEVVSDTLEGAATFVITVSAGKFVVDGVTAPVLKLRKGWTYTFDQSDSSNGNHPLRFTSGGNSYSTGVSTQGSSVIFKVPDAATNLAYICQNHSGMGNSITVIEDPITANQDNEANITAVAGNATNITAVAGNATNINAVAGNATNINAVQSNASNINAVASNETNINAVQSNASNINTVAGISANVTTVAGISANVTTVAGNTSNINSVQSNASNINTVAGSISDVNRYANEYQISASAPSSPSAGDLWFDTANNTLKNYNGSAWLGITSNSGIQNVSDDSSPELAGTLDCNDNNLTEVGTVSGDNLQIDFGTL